MTRLTAFQSITYNLITFAVAISIPSLSLLTNPSTSARKIYALTGVDFFIGRRMRTFGSALASTERSPLGVSVVSPFGPTSDALLVAKESSSHKRELLIVFQFGILLGSVIKL